MVPTPAARKPYHASLRPVQSNLGFTLIELLVVTALIGVLATMALISISDFKDKTKVSRAAAEIRGLEKDIISYATEKGTYPTSANVPGMENLKNLLDPWGNNYSYTHIPDPSNPPAAARIFIGVPINNDFDLFSNGPDKFSTDATLTHAQSKDDIVRGNDGAFVGTAEKYP